MYSDDCTKYFSVKAKQQKLATHICTILDRSGHRMEGFEDVGKVMFRFCKVLLWRQHQLRKDINPKVIEVGNVLSIAQQLQMCSSFSDKEIQEALFSIAGIKSRGPDGSIVDFSKLLSLLLVPLYVMQSKGSLNMCKCQNSLVQPSWF